jgi:hypothetical protein
MIRSEADCRFVGITTGDAWLSRYLRTQHPQERSGTLRSHTAALEERKFEIERRNLAVSGYGMKGFVLSKAETAIEMTDQRIPAEDIQTILAFGRTTL